MTKTIGVSESTWERLKKIMKRENAKDLDELISILIRKSEKVPISMFGADRELRIKYTQKEHEEFVKDTD
jgi:predicted CopG family antitoxin